jgi:mttA/Hcf106 family
MRERLDKEVAFLHFTWGVFMIQIFIQNDDGAHDLFATVSDLNSNPLSIALNNQRINRGKQAPANVQEDGNGNCLVSVHTVSADDPTVQKDFNNQVAQANGVISVDVF